MDKITLNPYLFFEGNAKEAMEFYKSIFGGELKVQLYGEIPGSGEHSTENMKDKVIHAALTGGDADLMASDAQATDALGTGKIQLSLSGGDEAKLTAVFNKLSEGGGTVKFALKKEYWGDTFGQVTDKYGVDWMLNINAPKEQAPAA